MNYRHDCSSCMTLYDEIEAECARTKDSPDVHENARIGLLFRAVWWPQIALVLTRADALLPPHRVSSASSAREFGPIITEQGHTNITLSEGTKE